MTTTVAPARRGHETTSPAFSASGAIRAEAGFAGDRGSSLRGPEPGEGPGVSLRGDGRGNHERARAGPRDPRRCPGLRVPRGAGGERPARDRPRALREPHPRGEREDRRQQPEGHRPPDRRRERLPALVPALRPRRGGRLRPPGRHRRRRRGSGAGAFAGGPRPRCSSGRRSRTSRPTGTTSWAAICGIRRTISPRAAKEFAEAVRLDPAYAPSWVSLSEVRILATFYGLDRAADAYAAAREPLARAKAGQGESAEALYVEGLIAFGERDWSSCERSLRRALELAPDYPPALCWSGMLRTILGRGGQAEDFRLAREADPLAPYPYAMHGISLLLSRQPAEAEGVCDQALAFEPENTLALWGAGVSRVALGRGDDGIAMLERALTPFHRGGFIHGALGWALARDRPRRRCPAGPVVDPGETGVRAGGRLGSVDPGGARRDRRGLPGARAGRGGAHAVARVRRNAGLRLAPGGSAGSERS